MECYLDNSATTAVLPEAADRVVRLMTTEYGNPSSMHKKGFEAEQNLKEAKEVFAGILKCTPQEIIFTSGGTESDNLAIIGAAHANQRAGRHIITTRIEHAAVHESFKALEKEGFSVSYLDVDESGIISLSQLSDMIREDTILVSIMHVNNEIGSVQPIAEAGALIKSRNPKCLFHVDDIQGFGKLKINPKTMKIDLISISGHKIHGPKGTGVLYINKSAKVLPLVLGGGQQKGMRSGTENVPGYVGMAVAANILNKSLLENSDRLYDLRAYFVKRLAEIPDVYVNGPAGFEYYKRDTEDKGRELFAPHIVSLSVKGIRAEVVLHALEDKDIYVSAGSACSSNKPAISETLKAIGVDKELLDSTVRFSMSVHTTREEIDYAVDALASLLPMLRKYTRK